MQSAKHHRSVPSVRLLNEIDILFAQVRLAELYLKQAQSTAAEQIASIHERYESQLEDLRIHIRQREPSVDESAARTDAEEDLHLRIQELQAGLEERRRLLENKEGEFQRVSAELETSRLQITSLQSATDQALAAVQDAERRYQDLQAENSTLRDRTERLERSQAQTGRLLAARAEQIRLRVGAELEELHARLTSKDRELQAVCESAAEAQAGLAATIDGLRLELAEKRQFVTDRDNELRCLEEKARALLERVAELEFSNRRLQAGAADALEQDRKAHREEFDNLLRQKDDAVRMLEARAAELQTRLDTQASDLRTQLLEKQRQLEIAAGEIADLKTRVSSLYEQTARMEAAGRDAEARSGAEMERIRKEHEAELISLKDELARKDHALAEQKSQFAELERRLGARMPDLESELAAKHRLLQEREEALNAANSSALALQERLSLFEAASRAQQISAANELDHVRRTLEAVLAGLRNESQQKDRELAERQALIDHLTQGHKNEIQALEAEVEKLRRAAECRAADLDRAGSERRGLLRRIGQLEDQAAAAEAAAITRIEQTAQRYETQMAALPTETEREKAGLKEQGAARNELEQSYRAEISRLQTESQEKELLLESRDHEFTGAKYAMEALRARVTQLEQAAAQAQQIGAEDRERMRAEYEAQLAVLEERLSKSRGFAMDQVTPETAQTKTAQVVCSRSDRRWRSVAGWKRRWKH